MLIPPSAVQTAFPETGTLRLPGDCAAGTTTRTGNTGNRRPGQLDAVRTGAQYRTGNVLAAANLEVFDRYVKHNAIAGRRFANWGAFIAHLDQWNREIADVRVHGTTGEPPVKRFADEAAALRPLGGRAPFGQLRDLVRKVRPDCAIDLDTNSYSVPWRLVGETVQVVVLAGRVIVRHAGEVVADHSVCDGRRQRIVDRVHLTGLVGSGRPPAASSTSVPPAALLRPLAEYEAVAGGGW